MARLLVLGALLSACGGGPVRAVTTTGQPGVCEGDADRRSCGHMTYEVPVESVGQTRVVHVALPAGEPGPSGFPVVVLFQGSLFSAARTWSATRDDLAGAFWQTATVEALLAAGFAVVAPEVRFFGVTFWDTNTPQWAHRWSEAPDHHLMLALLARIDDGSFGRLDGAALFAGGISSGGYMTSRLADAYPGRFRALAIHSASWATCAGPVCVLPDALPSGHPPTLFLHGEADAIVPIGTMREYEARLRRDGAPVEVVAVADRGHEWLEAAVQPIVAFFSARR